VKGLGTACVSEAVRRSHAVLAEVQKIVDAARTGSPHHANAITLNDWPRLAISHGAFPATVQAMTIERQGGGGAMPLAGFTYEAGLALWVASKGTEPPTPATVDVYRAHLSRLFNRLPHTNGEMNRVTPRDIIDHPEVLTSGSDGAKAITNKSANNHMASIRAVFRVAAFKQRISADPTVNTIKKLKAASPSRKGFDLDQHATIIAEALKLDSNDPRRWLWLIGCVTGARIGELADAKVSAVQVKSGIRCS